MIHYRTDYPVLNYLIKEAVIDSQESKENAIKFKLHWANVAKIYCLYWSPSSHHNISAYMYNALFSLTQASYAYNYLLLEMQF